MLKQFRIRSLCLGLLLLLAGPLWAVEVRFEVPGFDERSADDLRQASLVLDVASDPEATPQDLIAAARAEYGRQVRALYQKGHYGSVVSVTVDGREAANISPLSTPSRIDQIVVTIDAGPPFTFGTAQVAPLAPGTELPEGFTPGQRAHSNLVGDAAQAGVDGWRDVGHAKAEVADQSVVADHRREMLDADIRLRAGPRLTFGTLNVEGARRVNPERVRAIAGLPSGEVFSPEDLDTASTRLRRTGAFRSVVLEEAEQIGPGDSLDITVRLEEERRRRVGFGAELSSLEGVTLSGFWLHRSLFGGAERLRFDAEISGIGGDSGGEDYSLSARFDRPATFSPDTGLFIEASSEEINDPNFRERNIRLGAGLSHIFSDELTGELGLAYQYTEVDDALGSRTLEHLLLPGRLTYDGRDNKLNAKRGIFVDLEATPFYGLSDDVPGARLFVDARAYRGFGTENRFVFATRAQVGSVMGAAVDEVPADMLFFSGGAGTVRGQPFESLGIALPNGDLIGGRSFVGLSAELRAQVRGPWSVVGFADTGYIGEDSWGTATGDWHSGAGFGVRYDTGIGPIRVDVATPLGDDTGDGLELYIGIGQAF